MREFIENQLKKIKNKTYLISIPIEEFESKEEIAEFVKKAKQNGCGTVLHYETSNLHQGVLIQLFDKQNCKVKDYIGT